LDRHSGAHWIDIEVANFPPFCPGWVTVYPRGRCITPDTPAWHERRPQVEEVVKLALMAIAAQF
jgi:hypothetical protein